MALITRLARLWRADINALLDRLEAPDLVLTQAIREMEQALDTDRQALTRAQGEIERIRARLAGAETQLGQSAAALDDCLAEDRDDLARPLIRRRMEIERESDRLDRKRNALTEQSIQLAERIAERESKLSELRAQAAIYADERREPDATSAPVAGNAIRDDEVEIRLLQAKRRYGGAA